MGVDRKERGWKGRGERDLKYKIMSRKVIEPYTSKTIAHLEVEGDIAFPLHLSSSVWPTSHLQSSVG